MNNQLKYDLGEGQEFKFSVGDVVEVVKIVHDDDECRLGQKGVVVFVDMFDTQLTYKVAFLDDHDWFNAGSLRKEDETEYVTKIKTIQEGAGHWESFDERVNEFIRDKVVAQIDYKTLEDLRGLTNIIAIITYVDKR